MMHGLARAGLDGRGNEAERNRCNSSSLQSDIRRTGSRLRETLAASLQMSLQSLITIASGYIALNTYDLQRLIQRESKSHVPK